MNFFKIPPYYKNKSALEFENNIKYDKYAVLYIIIRHLYKEFSFAKNQEIPLSYMKKFNIKNLTFPLTYDSLQKLIKQNKHMPISINVLCDAEGAISNLGIISNEKCKKKNILHLLMFKTDTTANSVDSIFKNFNNDIKLKKILQNHYFYKIKNVQKLLNYRDYIISNKKIKSSQRHYYCEKCFLRFYSKTKKQNHFMSCNDNQTLIYPNKNTKLAFSNVTRSSKVPVLGFCDFESVLQRNCERLHCKQCNKDECQCNASKTQDINRHRPIGYSILFVDSKDNVFFQEEYAGEDCVKHFFKRLKHYQRIVEDQKKIFRKVSQIKASQDEWRLIHKAKKCYICNKPFVNNDLKFRKVVDHDHVTGKIIGAAHSLCNFKRQAPFHTPIFFHNAQG